MGKIGPDIPKPTPEPRPDTEQRPMDMNETFIQDKRAVRPKQPTESQPLTTHNRFETLNTNSEDDSTHTDTQNTRKPPPIIADIEIKDANTLRTLTGHFTQHITMKYNNKTLKIQTHTREAYDHVMNKLNQHNIKYHTYATERNNIDKRTLKGLPHTIKETEIQTELQNLNYPIEHVRQLKRTTVQNDVRTQTPLPIWILTFKKTDTLTDDIENLDTLFNVKIKIERYKGLTGITQCYRCQEFGHRAQYCRKTEKCVRCSGEHKVTSCNRNTPLKCANCNGEHPASYRQCPKYTKHTETQTQTQRPTTNPRQIPIRQNTRPAWGSTNTQTPTQNTLDPTQFPPLPQRDGHPQGTTPTSDTTNTLQELLTMLTNSNVTQHIQTILNIVKQIIQTPGLLTTILNLLTTFTQTQNGP